ncbi:putative sodium-coupled neutral amino acid transporter 11 isoform X2 [Protopterus annectens]|uniref:putative sodium-coupled neutral amino acid transporter 11 isoform X2 n=1 Tax=Protopterus annectens TaxID=7888 RepID=UPI001CF9B83E|nr:putative sodium-coupled neutral amino acid transporter 11 isoform X2 [Protopterus annectens]
MKLENHMQQGCQFLDQDPQVVEVDDRKSLVSKGKTEDEKMSSNRFSASFNVINSMMGSGIIGLPYSLKQAGFPLGIILLLVVGCITDYSIILLIKGGHLSGADSYQSLVNRTFGFTGYVVLSVLQFVYPFIAMVSYNIIAGDTLTKVFQRIPGVGPNSLLANRKFVILAFTIFLTLPLSLLRNVAKLGKVSLLSVVFAVLILTIVIVRLVTFGPSVPSTQDAWAFAQPNAIQAIGVVAFAFVCHHNSFLIYGSLRDPSLNNWSCITHVSTFVAVFISTLFAASAYATFTGYTQGDILENYCKTDDLATLGRFCYGMCSVLSFPIECFVTREGVLSATPLIFIVPSACYLKLSQGHWYQIDKLFSCVILIAGLLIMTTGLVMTILNPQGCSHGKEMAYCMSSNVTVDNGTLPSSSASQSSIFTGNML